MCPTPINKKTKHVLEKIAEVKDKEIKNFYLAGGTALAIQLGHRESIDLDWFIKKEFSAKILKNKLSSIGRFTLDNEERGTINGTLDKVNVSFLHYPYKLLFPALDFNGVKIADKRDIAAMKIDAISSRGSKKDFIDLFFLLKEYSLNELLGFFEKKYADIKYNKMHILKSLVYFEDAEKEPMPIMIKKIDWKTAKKIVIEEVKKFINS